MYQRFLNNNDYAGIITKELMSQLTRGNDESIAQAEEAAEASIVEYLTDNYEVEKELARGKSLMPYNPNIVYPVGAHFYMDGKIYEAIRSIAGIKKPTDKPYWKELEDYNEELFAKSRPYIQLTNWQPGDIVSFANSYFECVEPNGIDFNDIRIPGINGWEEKEDILPWEPNFEYVPWEVVIWDGKYYALVTLENIDLTVNPYDSDNWGLIGEYDPEYAYEFTPTEYIVYNNRVYYPVMSVVADDIKEGWNIRQHDPRNSNIKKHLVRLAVYELYKLISPNNVSSARIADYEASIMWLRDANRMKINPQIPRKLDEENKPVTEYAIATYMRDYDPYKNPWQV